MPTSRHRALYAAFDRFPSRKGAAVHIDRFARALFTHAGGGLLYVLGGPGLPTRQIEADDSIEILRFDRHIPNYLQRALAFSARLSDLLDHAGSALEICHFRDPWSGVPIVSRPRGYAAVYEVNGLPSIELPFAFPGVAAETLRKVRADEARCWTEADVVVVPAETIRATLVRLGCPAAKISVVPNGADPAPPGTARPDGAPAHYLLYFGALQPWQGIGTLLRAFARLADYPDLRLVICAARESREQRRQQALADRLGLGERVLWRFSLAPDQLAPWREHALLSVAPLTECARNLEQGCAPLKILESMAAGVPVVASDLPSVREIISDGADGRLIPPDRPAELARAIRLLIDYPEERAALGRAARATIEARFTWRQSLRRLTDLYQQLSPARTAWQIIA